MSHDPLSDLFTKVQTLKSENAALRKRLTEIQCPHCKTVYDHLYPEKPDGSPHGSAERREAQPASGDGVGVSPDAR